MLTYNGSILKVGGSTLDYGTVPPYPPLPDVPAGGLVGIWEPGTSPKAYKGTKTQLYEEPNIWLIVNAGDWQSIFDGDPNLTELIAANPSGVQYVTGMFEDCSALTRTVLFDLSGVGGDLTHLFSGCASLTEVPLFDLSGATSLERAFLGCVSLEHVPLFYTASVESMQLAFAGCMSLKAIPAFDMSSIRNLTRAFAGCSAVESGMYALYSAAEPHGPYHSDCFAGCGTNTAVGMAERALIPAEWGGDMY